MGSWDLGGGPSCVTFIAKTNQPKQKQKQKTSMSNRLIWHSFTSGSKTSECIRDISEVYEDIDSGVHPVGKGHLLLFWQMHQENLWDISLGVNKPWISCLQSPHSYLRLAFQCMHEGLCLLAWNIFMLCGLRWVVLQKFAGMSFWQVQWLHFEVCSSLFFA